MQQSFHRLLKDGTHRLTDRERSEPRCNSECDVTTRDMILTSTTCESFSHLLRTVWINAKTCWSTTTT